MSSLDNDQADGEDERVDDKHRWDAKDLEKVTQFHDDGDEMGEVSKESLIGIGQNKLSTIESKIVLKKDDINLIMSELDVPQYIAEKKLIEHKGDVKEALRDLIMN